MHQLSRQIQAPLAFTIERDDHCSCSRPRFCIATRAFQLDGNVLAIGTKLFLMEGERRKAEGVCDVEEGVECRLAVMTNSG